MNVVTLIGRIARTVEMKGKVANGVIAVDRPYPFNKDQDDNQVSDFLNIKFIGENNAERAERYLTKGVKIALRGIVCRDSYKKDDEWKEYNYIIVQDWEFAESKKAAESNQGDAPANDDFMDVDGSDTGIPFN